MIYSKLTITIPYHKIFTLLAGLLLAQPVFASPRVEQVLDDNWKFFQGDDAKASGSSFDDSKWQPVTLPHDWSIAGPSEATNGMGGQGGFFPAGLGWYRYQLDAPADWKGKSVFLEFEGVYQHAEIFLNGTSLTSHPYGYTSFIVDLSKALKPGEKNVLAVKVDNSEQKNCRWYSGSGIYRHVRLFVTDPVHLVPYGIFVTVPKADASAASINIKAEVINEGSAATKVTVKNALFGPDGKLITSFPPAEIALASLGSGEIKVDAAVNTPPLWSPENPLLSKVVTQIYLGDKLVDEVTTPIGIRHLAWSADKGMTINGKTYKLNGGCIHHDNGVLGACAFDRAEERKIEILKASGFNAIRTAHNPPSPALLDACDRLGMLVMDEAFDCWVNGKHTKYDYHTVFKEWWQRDLDSMVRRDRNHPSVVLWSIGNEIPNIGGAMGGEFGPKLADRVRWNDPTRPVTNGILGWPYPKEAVASGAPQPTPDPKDLEKIKNYELNWNSLDIVGSNYALANHVKDHEQHPTRILVGTESPPPLGMSKEVLENSFVIGDFVWSAQDYLGEVGVGRSFYIGDPTEPPFQAKNGMPVMHGSDSLFPWRGANCGNIDLLGFQKAACHRRNVVWGTEKLSLAVKEPVPEGKTLKVVGWGWWPTFESWTWPGYEGKTLTAEIHSSYGKFRLYLNDKLIAEKGGTSAQIDLPYAPGVLKLVGVQNDKEVESRSLETVGAPTALKLSPDRSLIHADGQDLSFVTVEAVDAKGRRDPNANHEVRFTLNGSGSIAGLGNANLKSTEPYVGTRCHLYHGRALVVIRTTRQTGSLSLTAKSEGLAEAKITIEAAAHTDAKQP